MEDRSKKAISQALNDAQNLLYSSEQTIREYSDKFSADDLRDIKSAMYRLISARDAGPGRTGELLEATETLQAYMHKFAELIYNAPRSGDRSE